MPQGRSGLYANRLRALSPLRETAVPWALLLLRDFQRSRFHEPLLAQLLEGAFDDRLLTPQLGRRESLSACCHLSQLHGRFLRQASSDALIPSP